MTVDSAMTDAADVSTALVPCTPATSELANFKAVLPAILTDAGEDAVTRFVEYFTAHIRNPHRDLPVEKRGGAGSPYRRNPLVPAQNETVNSPVGHSH